MVLPDAFKVEQIFNEIGYHPIFRYEKFRTEYAKAPSTGKVLLDETPIGNYLEIEGSSAMDRQHRASARLFDGRLHHPQLRLSCIWPTAGSAECPPSNMLFTAKDMRQLRKNKTNA